MHHDGSVDDLLLGVVYGAAGDVPYPRADPDDAARLPPDTWEMAQVPAGVHLRLAGSAPSVRITYETATGDLGRRGEPAGRTFEVWRDGVRIDEAPAAVGAHAATVAGPDGGAVHVYLPEGMRPEIVGVDGVGGDLEPTRRGPRWVCYGDSITEGWGASGPATSWVAIVGRMTGADVLNMGYAGAARGEAVSAEHVASRQGDLITLSFGTNCWAQTPHRADELADVATRFLRIVRSASPDVPLLVVSPVIRPDAETTPNAAGATLVDLRAALEDVARSAASTDADLTLLEGGGLLTSAQLADGIHPNDDGHRVLADHIGRWARAVLVDHPRRAGTT